MVEIYEHCERPDHDPELDPDNEFALSEGTIFSSRYHWVSVREELATVAEKVIDKVLRIGQKGMIDSVRWEKNDVSRPLEGEEVAIKPHTVGVNFRVSHSFILLANTTNVFQDVLQTMGLIDGDDLGGECSGVVEAVGPDVTDIAVGDRVFMMVPYCFSNRVITWSKLVAKIPDSLSLDDAATMPITFITVIHAIINLRQLQKEDASTMMNCCGSY